MGKEILSSAISHTAFPVYITSVKNHLTQVCKKFILPQGKVDTVCTTTKNIDDIASSLHLYDIYLSDYLHEITVNIEICIVRDISQR